MNSTNERLKEERERLGYTQPEFAAIGGTTKKSQVDYEKGHTEPRVGYLFKISRVGADVQYIVTGERSIAGLCREELLLIETYRQAHPAVKQYMLNSATPIIQNVQVNGYAQVAFGDQSNAKIDK